MASSSLRKLLRIQQPQSASRILTFLTQIQTPQIAKPYHPSSFPAHPQPDPSKPNQSSCAHVYPTFPFGFFPHPISPNPLIRIEPNDDVVPVPDEPDVVIRADSVKKKRKKKMNKHKLRKLRKRLRRKTKT